MAVAIVSLNWDISADKSCDPCRTSLTTWVNDQEKAEKDPGLSSFQIFYFLYVEDIFVELQNEILEEILEKCVKSAECNINIYAEYAGIDEDGILYDIGCGSIIRIKDKYEYTYNEETRKWTKKKLTKSGIAKKLEELKETKSWIRTRTRTRRIRRVRER